MSRIALDRWEAAQTAEFGHHQDLRPEAYITATNVIGKYLVSITKKTLRIK